MPLQAKTSRANDEHPADARSRLEFLVEDRCLDRLAEADLVGDEDARHRSVEVLDDRLELIWLELSPRRLIRVEQISQGVVELRKEQGAEEFIASQDGGTSIVRDTVEAGFLHEPRILRAEEHRIGPATEVGNWFPIDAPDRLRVGYKPNAVSMVEATRGHPPPWALGPAILQGRVVVKSVTP